MDKYIYNEKNGLWYEVQGDYDLPCLKLPEERTAYIGVWGQRHLRYLKQYHRVRYYILLTSGKLNSYLADIDRQALNGTNIAKSNTGGAGIQKMNTDWLVIQDDSTPDGRRRGLHGRHRRQLRGADTNTFSSIGCTSISSGP